ncbi:MAG: hypothetical protein ABI369_01145 [Acetobacteraceae bacterium]
MNATIDVTIPVEADIAAALSDPEKREAAGRLLTRILRPKPDLDPLVQAIAKLKAQAHAAGLTDEIIDEELAAYNAERRD